MNKDHKEHTVKPRRAFVNAQVQHAKHPDTFDVPSDRELAGITTGMFVKVCTGTEQFWVCVIEKYGDQIRGAVDNALMCGSIHGLKLGDVIKFKTNNVYAIFQARDKGTMTNQVVNEDKKANEPKKKDRVNVRLTLKDLAVISTRLGAKPEFEIWLSSDEEGNSYSPLMQFGDTVNFAVEEKKKRITLYPSSMDTVDPCTED